MRFGYGSLGELRLVEALFSQNDGLKTATVADSAFDGAREGSLFLNREKLRFGRANHDSSDQLSVVSFSDQLSVVPVQISVMLGEPFGKRTCEKNDKARLWSGFTGWWGYTP